MRSSVGKIYVYGEYSSSSLAQLVSSVRLLTARSRVRVTHEEIRFDLHIFFI